ncbi:MAG: SHOCT domain-containing protein [Candidatus Hydrogenedentes bacterium]|nr:SHOCT domain-containing protein [Candidatus Hydrogenedentota bacterium]
MDVQTTKDRADFIRRISDYEKVSAILWLILAIIQICSLVGIIAGIWNLFASFSRFGIVKKIRNRDPEVLSAYEGMGQLIVIGLINLFLGAAIGVVFVAFDFYIRDQILKNKHVFAGEAEEADAGLSFVPQALTVNMLDQLERLASLRETGVLDESEFLREKQRLLGSTQT